MCPNIRNLKNEHGKINQLLYDQSLINRFLIEKLIKDSNDFYGTSCNYIYSIDSRQIVYTFEDMIPNKIQLLIDDIKEVKIDKNYLDEKLNESLHQIDKIFKENKLMSNSLNNWIRNNNKVNDV